MTTDELASRIAHHWWGENWPNVPNREGDLQKAREALALLGLDDWEAAVDRAGHALADECQDRYGFRMALGQRDILAEVVLRAALTPTEGGELDAAGA